MPYRRRSLPSPKISRAAGAACEMLENRRLLTSVIHGKFTDTVDPFNGSQTVYEGQTFFQFKQANGNADIRISVTGDLTAEFIGAQWTQFSQSQLVLTDLMPDTELTNTDPLAAGTFLFSIYIVHSDANCSISISQVALTTANNPNATLGDGNVDDARMTPFSGGLAMRIINATTGASQLINPADGGAYLGAETINATPPLATAAQSIPLIWSTQSGFGLRPASAGKILAGVVMAPGNNLNKFFFGGTVTGYVDLGGNVNTFYAGNILTGDAAGISALGDTSDLRTFNINHFPHFNFHSDGDIGHLISANSFGTLTLTAPNTAGNFETVVYKTGFQLDVAGRVSDMHGNDSFLGQATIRDSAAVTGLGTAQHELEYRGTALAAAGDASFFDPLYFGNDISLGETTNDARFNNDTFDTAQYLGTLRSQQLNDNNAIQLLGALGNDANGGATDNVDYFGVALLAGQTVTFQLLDNIIASGTTGLTNDEHPRLGIFDPTGRLIASDYSNLDEFSRVNKPIQIKAAVPGVYRVAIANFGDFNFNGTDDTGGTPAEPTFTPLVNNPYQLRITGAGDIALGGLTVNQHLGTLDQADIGIQVLHGDLGAVRAGLGVTGQGSGQIFSFSNPWYVPTGNFRSMEAFSLGNSGTIIVLDSGPDLLVRKGSIGLLRTSSTSTTNTLSVNDNLTINEGGNVAYPASTDDLSATNPAIATGMNIQLVDCGGVLEGDLLANGAIGVIRAQIIGGLRTDSFPVFQANVNNIGNDGTIDLIDVTSTSTTAAVVNSPAITTGDGGDVRYFHVQPNAVINADEFFGNGLQAERTFAPGAQVSVTDDSGARMLLTPLPRDPSTTSPLPPDALSAFIDPPALSILTYPVRDKSGVILMRVTVTPVDDTTDGVVNPGGGGLMVQSSTTNGRAEAEISDIELNRVPAGIAGAGGFTGGDPFTFQPFTLAPYSRLYTLNTQPAAPAPPIRDQDLIFQGATPIDIWNINAFSAGMNITNLTNSTTGEIVNITGAPNIFNMVAENIGVAASHTGTTVEGGTLITGAAAALPFSVPGAGGTTAATSGQRNLINVGNVNSMLAREAIGNVNATNIATIGANSDGKNVPGVFEGIVGPIVSRGAGSDITGNIVTARIGEGVASSGTGLFSRAGIFADGILDLVTGTGDIHGAIAAEGNTTFVSQTAVDPITGAALLNPDGTQAIQRTPTYFIGGIRLNGGSIIDANVVVSSIAAGGTGYVPTLEFPSSALLQDGPTHTAGFPGTFTAIAGVRLDGLGGIIGTQFRAADIGQIAINGGFGIMSSEIRLGGPGDFAGIATDGYGIRDISLNGGATTGTILARGTGKHTPTSAFSASVRNSEVTNFDPFSGIAVDRFNDLDKELGTTAAKPYNGTNTDLGVIQDSRFSGNGTLGKVEAYRILARNVLTSDPATNVKTKIPQGSQAYPMRISFPNSTGSIIAHDVVNGLALVTGRLSSFVAAGNVENTAINVGSLLQSVSVGAFLGTSSIKMTAPGGILQSLTTLHSLFGTVVVAQDITSIKVGTDVGSPKIYSGRNIKTFTVNGSVLTGANITVAKTLSSLAIGGDVKVNSRIQAHAIQKQVIKGQIFGVIAIV